MERPADQATLAEGAPPRGLGKVFRAFSYRDYRLLWTGAFTSSCGTWMQEFAQNWLIFTISGSVKWLGWDAFLGEIPFVLFSLIGGVVADRLDRRKILLGSQVVQLTNAFLLASLVYFHLVAIWQILALSFVTGFAQSFGGPAYQALVPTLVEKKDVPNAVALQSIQFNLARVIGPVLAGLAFAALGAAACFALNGVSFFAVIASLLLIRSRFVRRTDHPPVLHSLKEGVRFVLRNRTMMSLTVLAFAGSFLAMPLVTFLPVYAKQIFAIGPKGYSHLLAAFGIGAVAGALAVASLGNFRRKGVTAIAVQIVFAGLIVAFALCRVLWVSQILLFLAGAALVMVFAIFTSLVQLLVEDEMRGRVGSVYTLAFRGAMPLGNLVGALFAARYSVTAVLVVNGIVLAITASTVLWTRRAELSQI
jgi:predicted MFS family arabinose efflux permease